MYIIADLFNNWMLGTELSAHLLSYVYVCSVLYEIVCSVLACVCLLVVCYPNSNCLPYFQITNLKFD